MNINPDAASQSDVPPIPRPEDMPDSSGMALNYLVDPIKGDSEVTKLTFNRYFNIALVGFIFAFIGHLFGDFLATQEGLVLMLTIGPLLSWIVNKTKLGQTLSARLLFWLTVLPLLTGLLLIVIYYLGTQSSPWFTLSAAIGLTILAYFAIEHFLLILSTHPEDTPNFSDVSVPILVCFPTAIFLTFVVTLSWIDSISARYLVMLMILAAVALVKWFKNSIMLSDWSEDWHEFMKSIIRAAYVWIDFGRAQNIHHPGVFNPPKSVLWRVTTTGLATIILSIGLLPSNSYFPVVYKFGPSAWFDEAYIDLHRNEQPLNWKNWSLTLLTEKSFGFELDTTTLKKPPREDASPAEFKIFQDELNSWQKKEATRFMREVPFGVVWLFIDLAFAKHSSLLLLAALLSLVLCFLMPIATVLIALLGSPIVLAQEGFVLASDHLKQPKLSPKIWNLYVNRMLHSSDALERQHLFLGEHHPSGVPILLDQSILNGHAYISGDTGSGKTSLGIIPLLTQLLQKTNRQFDPAKRLDASFVIIDLKGDPALFHTARQLAEAQGLPFRWFTSESGRSSYAFNPLDQRAFNELSEIAMTELQMAALSLEHGEGYGGHVIGYTGP